MPTSKDRFHNGTCALELEAVLICFRGATADYRLIVA